MAQYNNIYSVLEEYPLKDSRNFMYKIENKLINGQLFPVKVYKPFQDFIANTIYISDFRY